MVEHPRTKELKVYGIMKTCIPHPAPTLPNPQTSVQSPHSYRSHTLSLGWYCMGTFFLERRRGKKGGEREEGKGEERESAKEIEMLLTRGRKSYFAVDR